MKNEDFSKNLLHSHEIKVFNLSVSAMGIWSDSSEIFVLNMFFFRSWLEKLYTHFFFACSLSHFYQPFKLYRTAASRRRGREQQQKTFNLVSCIDFFYYIFIFHSFLLFLSNKFPQFQSYSPQKPIHRRSLSSFRDGKLNLEIKE